MKQNKVIKITAKGNSLSKAWYELLNSQSLLREFTYRDLKIRYAQTYLGFLWSVLQPLTSLAVLFVLFYKLAGLQPNNVPYLPFALSGLLLWNFFSFVLSQSAAVLINMQAMIKKIYFPKLCLPISKVLVGSVDFMVALALFIGLMLYYSISLGGIWAFIPALFFTLSAAIGLGMLLSAFSIRYRDVQQLVPFFTQMLFFLTPVAYATALVQNLIPQKYEWVYFLNPLVGALNLLRNSLFGLEFSTLSYLSFGVALVFLFTGLYAYVKAEKKMADLL